MADGRFLVQAMGSEGGLCMLGGLKHERHQLYQGSAMDRCTRLKVGQ